MNSSTNLVRSRALVATVAALLLVAAACTSSGPSTATKATSSGAAASSDTGSANTDAGSSKQITKADLTKLLPSASTVGGGFTEGTSSDTSSTSDTSDSSSSDSFQTASEKQCPELAKLSKGDKTNRLKAKRTFSSTSHGTIEVQLQTKAKAYSDKELNKQIQAVNDCGEITTTLSGNEAKVTFSAKRDDSRGDQGVILTATIKVAIAQLNKAFTLTTVAYSYRVGSVGVTVTATGDIDQQTLTAVEPDQKTAKAVATELEPKVKKLVNG